MKKFTFKGIFAFILFVAFSATQLAAQTATITPANSTIFRYESQDFTVVTTGLGANNDNRTFAYTIVGPGATIPATPTSINCTTGCNSETHTFQFPTPGVYTVSVIVTQTQGGSAVASTSTQITVVAPNLWSVSGTGDLRQYVVDPVLGNLINGPSNVIVPLTSTAAVAKNQITLNDPDACIYYLNRDDGAGLNGVVTIYSLRPDGTGHGSRGTIDMNGGGNNDDFSYVRFGFDALGRGWIIAGSGANIYIASFQGNGVNPISAVNTFGNIILTVAAPGVAADFQNGDLAITATGTLYALANVTGGDTYVYTLNSLSTPTTLTRKWTVQTGGGIFTGTSVNGLAWTQSGSLHFSTGTGIYFIDQFTANQVSGTVQATLVAGTGGLGLTDLGSDRFPTQTTLPVTLISFTGSYRNQNTSLNWVTENIQDFDHFEIERSSNGTAFISIGSKQPTGNLVSRTTYLYNDDLSAVGGTTFYYRLKMIDLNGQVRYSNVILVRKDGKSITGIRISPNPIASGSMTTVRFEAAANGTVDFRILDMAGRVVLTQQNNIMEGTNSVPVNNLNRLQPGTYVLQMNDGTAVHTTKFIIAQ